MLADVHGRPAARPDVPEADALGRVSRRRQGRRSCSRGRFAGSCCCTAAASCRSSSAAPSWRRVRPCRTSGRARSTYGHRFLTTSGRAGRAIKVKTFEDYQARLLENFVILDRAERESRIRRELETHARRLGGRVSGLVAAHSSLLQEVPDLVEYPVGRRRTLPGGVPPAAGRSADDDDDSSPALLPGGGRGRKAEAGVSGRDQHAAGEAGDHRAQRRARADGAAARRAVLLGRGPQGRRSSRGSTRLATILFHKKLGSYREKAERVAALARWIAETAFEQPERGRACRAGRTAVQGRPGHRHGARAHRAAGHDGRHLRARRRTARGGLEGDLLPLPAVGVEADAPPSRQQLGGAAVTWAAVSLADKLDSVVGMFTAGERPTGSRDPLGLRRQAQGAVKILADLPGADGPRRAAADGSAAGAGGGAVRRVGRRRGAPACRSCRDRLGYLLEQRGFDVRNVRAVLHGGIERVSPLEARRKLEALAQMSGSEALLGVATLLKRVKNITKGVGAGDGWAGLQARLVEPAEQALWSQVDARAPGIREAAATRRLSRSVCRHRGAAAGRREVLRRRAGDGGRRGAAAGAAGAWSRRCAISFSTLPISLKS